MRTRFWRIQLPAVLVLGLVAFYTGRGPEKVPPGPPHPVSPTSDSPAMGTVAHDSSIESGRHPEGLETRRDAEEAVVDPDARTPSIRRLLGTPWIVDERFPPLREDFVGVLLHDPDRVPLLIRSSGRRIRSDYWVLPVQAAIHAEEELRSVGLILPVFGMEEERIVLTETVIVRFREQRHLAELERLGEVITARHWRRLMGPENLYAFTLAPDAIPRVLDTLSILDAREDVLYAEPGWRGIFPRASADPLFGQQWGLENTGQFLCDPVPGIRPDADLDILDAWGMTAGSTHVLIAVLDDGVEWDHPDLAGAMAPSNLWFDAVDNDADPRPSSGDTHGTGIAGILSATRDNGVGVSGVAPDCRILPIRIADGSGSGGGWTMDLTDAIQGIGWAADHGASVLNLSWTTGSLVPFSLRDAIRSAMDSGRSGHGCIVAVSSGNEDVAITGFPATMPEVLTVGATSPADERKSATSVDGESSWGSCYDYPLDCVAPGVKIMTTDLKGSAGASPTDYNCRFGGTSAAAPFAAGVAALMLSADPSLSQSNVVSILCATAERVGGYEYAQLRTHGFWNTEMGYGRIHAHHAVLQAAGVDCIRPRIDHVPVPGQSHGGPFLVRARITDPSGMGTGLDAPRLYYRVNEGSWTPAVDADGPTQDDYVFTIPSVPLGSTVDYYLAAQDASPQANTESMPSGAGGISPPGTSPPVQFFRFSVDAQAGLITVNDDGPADYASIQAAINAATYGDTIRVAGGTYQEILHLSNRSHLQILGGYSEDFSHRSLRANPSIVDANHQATAISLMYCTAITVDGFDLVNGEGSYLNGSARWAGGFMLKGGNDIRLAHLNVTGGHAYAGGAGAIYLTENARLEFSRLFGNNTQKNSSALYIRECSPVLSYVEVSRNTCNEYGSAIGYYYGGGELRNLTVVDNVAQDPEASKYGISFFPSWRPVIMPALINCLVVENYGGGGTYISNLEATKYEVVQNCIYADDAHPQFLDPDHHRYHLRAGSLGIDAGRDWGQTIDLESRPVPWGTHPDVGAYEYRPDLDEDGMPDAWEVDHGCNPFLQDAHDDDDLDLSSNQSEYIAGTDPGDPESFFEIDQVGVAAGQPACVMTWHALSGRLYSVWATPPGGGDTWIPTAFLDLPGTDGPMSVTTEPAAQSPAFYRVEIELAQ